MTTGKSCAHFVTGTFKCHATFLPDDTYGVVLDNVVKACTDILIVHDNKVLIGRRNGGHTLQSYTANNFQLFPQKSWWYGCGGRMKPGESPKDSLYRILKRELGLVIEDYDRIQFVGSYSYVWRLREQLPKDHGTADISAVHTLTLTDEEKNSMTLDRTEYAENVWLPAQEIINGDYHPALIRSVCDLVKMQQYQEIERMVENGTDDATIAAAVKNMVRDAQKAGKNDGEKVLVKDTLELAESAE